MSLFGDVSALDRRGGAFWYDTLAAVSDVTLCTEGLSGSICPDISKERARREYRFISDGYRQRRGVRTAIEGIVFCPAARFALPAGAEAA
jgi:hypothetical protein